MSITIQNEKALWGIGVIMKDIHDDKTLDWLELEKEKMNPTFEQVQVILNLHAKKIGRSEGYAVSVIKDVIKAIKGMSSHPLKDVVVNGMDGFKEEKVSDRRRKCLAQFCEGAGHKKYLAEVSGLGVRSIDRWIDGEFNITNQSWTLLLDSFDRAKMLASWNKREVVHMDRKIKKCLG